MIPQLIYNNSDKTVTITLSDGSVRIETQPTGWAVEKLFGLSNIVYSCNTID